MLTAPITRPLRVIQLLPTLQRRGLEKVVCAIALDLHGQGYEVDVCCLRTAGPLEASLRERGLRVYCLEEKGPRDLQAAWRLLSILRSGNYDIVHSHCPVEAGYQVPIAWLARVPRVICTFHLTPGLPAPPAVEFKAKLRKLVARLVSRGVDWVYACSGAALKAQQQGGWRGRNSSVIYNGIDLTHLYPSAAKALSKAALGLPADSCVIGSVGSLCEQKGHSHLIRALALIRCQIPNA